MDRTITWKGSPNEWVGRNGESIVAICDHIMQGTMGGTFQTFEAAITQVSAHFAVSKIGEVWQYVREENTAWANGIWEDPDLSVPFLADAMHRGVNPNYLTLSIEHEGMTGDPMPEEQYQATLWLHRYLIGRHPFILPDRNHVIGHYQISALSRAHCPGDGFPWSRLMADLQTPENIQNPGYSWQDDVTRYWVVDPFANFYVSHGGIAIFGRPIGPMTLGDPKYPDMLVQNFERARFEQPTAWAGTGRVQLGLVNSQLLGLSR